MLSGVMLHRITGLPGWSSGPRPVCLLLATCTAGCSLAALAEGAFVEGVNLPVSASSPARPRLELSSAMSSMATSGQSVVSTGTGSDYRRGTTRDATGIRMPGDTVAPPLRLEISSWSRLPEESAMGLAIGLDTPSSAPAESRGGSSLDVGVRWRSTPINLRRIDVVAFRRVSQPQDAYSLINSSDQPLYSARVEMQFQSAKFGGLAPELGAIGMQLNGGGKVVLRTKRGGPMVYYRARF